MKSSRTRKTPSNELVFLFDVDNTLLDNDRVIDDLRKHLHREVGPQRARQYWCIFEALRSKLGYADYLGALQRYRIDHIGDLLHADVPKWYRSRKQLGLNCRLRALTRH